jgi:CheY-like chemotaxis protein
VSSGSAVIVVVDDDAQNLRLLARLLTLDGYEMHTAGIIEALSLALRWQSEPLKPRVRGTLDEFRALQVSPCETLANLSLTGHLRCFSDQRLVEIVQCGEPILSSSSPRPCCESSRLTST